MWVWTLSSNVIGWWDPRVWTWFMDTCLSLKWWHLSLSHGIAFQTWGMGERNVRVVREYKPEQRKLEPYSTSGLWRLYWNWRGANLRNVQGSHRRKLVARHEASEQQSNHSLPTFMCIFNYLYINRVWVEVLSLRTFLYIVLQSNLIRFHTVQCRIFN